MKKLEGAGLRGQTAGQTSLSTVEQEGSLRHLGYKIEDLAKHASFEEVAYLLLLGHLPNKEQLSDFENELMPLRAMPDSLVSVLESIPAEAHPMEVIRTIISYIGVTEPEISFDDQLSISKRLLGVTSTAIVYWYKHSHENIIRSTSCPMGFAEMCLYASVRCDALVQSVRPYVASPHVLHQQHT